MKLKYCKMELGNFGDDLNEWLWPELLGEHFFDDDESELFYGVGTIISYRMNGPAKKVLMGCGAGYKRNPGIDQNFDIRFVRGPLTAKRLGISPKHAVGDAAYLVSCTTAGKKLLRTEKKNGVALIPHCHSLDSTDWATIAERSGTTLVSPREHYFDVFRKIAESECVLTESLHGAIMADVFRVPWIPFKIGHSFNDFKWQDWLHSVSLPDCQIHEMPVVQSYPLNYWEFIRNCAKAATGHCLNIYKWKQRPCWQSTEAEMNSLVEKISKTVQSAPVCLSSEINYSSAVNQMIEHVENLKNRQPLRLAS